MQLEERKLDEIAHANRRYRVITDREHGTDGRGEHAQTRFASDEDDNKKFYSITRSSRAWREKLLYEGIGGRTALDYCCGSGAAAVEMAARGAARVCGIDISEVAIGNARNLAASREVASTCEFEVMDAENTRFADNTFDVIHESGALHHLELKAAFRELARILKPDGRVVCAEGLRHNPLIHRYRRRTPQLRTAWEVEHILGVPEIRSGAEYFRHVEVRFFHLAALAAVPFRNRAVFLPLLSLLEGVDRVLLRIPGLRRMAWIAVIVYHGPRKGTTSVANGPCLPAKADAPAGHEARRRRAG